jgi:excisionase family DNA binding protein
MNQAVVSDVLTLEEAANYLKLSSETIEREAAQGNIPGRQIGDSWRFLKSAIDEWLRGRDNRAVLLRQAGALKDDPYADELLKMIYEWRGRPEVDEAEDAEEAEASHVHS